MRERHPASRACRLPCLDTLDSTPRKHSHEIMTSPSVKRLIGTSTVEFKHIDALPETLSGLTRLKVENDNAPANITIKLAVSSQRTWEINIIERNRWHQFGRPSHLMSVNPAAKHAAITFVEPFPKGHAYWIKRDIFGLLACLSGEVMLHCSSIEHDGLAYLFCADSGVGKSTIANLLRSQGAKIVNDEINWLHKSPKDDWRLVNQLYWMKGHPAPELPVARIFLLEQAPYCEIVPGPPKPMLFAKMIASHISIENEAGTMESRARALVEMLGDISVQTLRFNLNPEEVAAKVFASRC